MIARAPLMDRYAGMNKTEQRRAIELEAMKRAGLIHEWWYERFTFKLAHDTRYTPDFAIQENDGAIRLEETKGFMRDDANVKVKVYASQFPFPIRVLRWIKGAWQITEV